MEQHFGPAAVQLHVSELVDAQKIDSSVAGDGFGELAFVGGFDQFVDQFRGQGVADPEALLGGGGPRPMNRWDFPVPESPVRQSGSPLRIQSPPAR